MKTEHVMVKYTAAALALFAIGAEMTRDFGGPEQTTAATPEPTKFTRYATVVGDKPTSCRGDGERSDPRPLYSDGAKDNRFLEVSGILADEEYGEHKALPVIRPQAKLIAHAKLKPTFRPKRVQRHARLIAQKPKAAPFQPLIEEPMERVAVTSFAAVAPDTVSPPKRGLKQKITRFFAGLKAKFRHRAQDEG